jgi:PhnB protein
MTTDPFDRLGVLADVDPDVQPDPRFVARLRARVASALIPSPDDLPVVDLPERSSTMTDTASEAPTIAAVQPYICVNPAVEAIAWYRDVFGAVETIRYTGDDGRIGHAEITIGGATVMLSDPYPELDVVSPRELGGTPVTLHLVVPDVDAVYARAIERGGRAAGEPEYQSYGARSFTMLDPFGHRWMVQTPVGSPTTEQVQDATTGYTITTPEEPPTDA